MCNFTLPDINPICQDKQICEILSDQKKKYAHRRNVILGIIKAHYNIVKTRPSNVNCRNAIEPIHARLPQRCHHSEFIILFISPNADRKKK